MNKKFSLSVIGFEVIVLFVVFFASARPGSAQSHHSSHKPILDSVVLQTHAITDGGTITLTVNTSTDAPFQYLIVQVLGPELNNTVTYNQNYTETSTGEWQIDFAYDISPWLPSGVYTLTNIFVINESSLQSEVWPTPITFTVQNGASTWIEPETGGVLTYTNKAGQMSVIQIPPGAVTQTIELDYVPIETVTLPDDLFVIGDRKFQLQAYVNGRLKEHFAFEKPITTTFYYSDSDVVGDESELKLYLDIDGEWTDSANTCDPASEYTRSLDENLVRVPICHLTQFSLLGVGNKYYFPLIFR